MAALDAGRGGAYQVLIETTAHDAGGQVLAGSFMDYALPRADMVPSFSIELAEDPTAGNPLKVKGGGEAGVTPALAVIVNAIVDALSVYGIEHIEMPATAPTIWCRAARRAQKPGPHERTSPRPRCHRPRHGGGHHGAGGRAPSGVVVLAAAADPLPGPREAFARDFNARTYADARAVCEDAAVEAVYIATPHQFHAEHAIAAAECGKHVILEKPMALTLADCDRIIAAVERAKVHLIVGHTHAFDPAVRAMRALIAAGEMGALGMIASWNYTNYLYRPRRPEELDTAKGGGILFNQVPHQIDTVRLLAGGLVRSVRAQVGVLDPARATEANCTAFLEVRRRRLGLPRL